MKTYYQVEKAILTETQGDCILNRAGVNGLELRFTKGVSAASLSQGKIRTGSYFDNYLNTTLKRMIELGEIDDGSKSLFDDRKLRYDLAIVSDSSRTLTISFGATHFKAFKADLNRSDEDNLQLQQEGSRRFADRYAFFSRAAGIAVLPIIGGAVYIGKRTNKEMSGYLNAVAGHLKFRENPEKIDLKDDLKIEMKEEFGIKPESIVGKPIFVGVYSHPIAGCLDFTFIAKTNVPSSYIDSGEWINRVQNKEHQSLIKLATMSDVRRLLLEGVVPDGRKFPLMHSTRGALESLTEAELKIIL